jgi:CRP-like cAMP-binding protein
VPSVTREIEAINAAARAEDGTEPARKLLVVSQESEVELVNEQVDVGVDNDEILTIAGKPPWCRADEELVKLRRFTSGVKFFKNMSTAEGGHEQERVVQQQLELCKFLTHRTVAKDSPIFMQGDVGTQFYIIYKGAVRIYVADPSRVSGGTILPDPNKTDEENELEPYGTCVVVLEDGDAFGELALLGNGLRAATVVAAMETQLFIIDKEAYDNSVLHFHEAEQKDRLRFLRHTFLFADWDDAAVHALAKVVSRKKYAKGSVVIKQGHVRDPCMHLIVSGRCRVLKRMELDHDLQLKLATSREGVGVSRLLKDGQRADAEADAGLETPTPLGGRLGGSASAIASSSLGGPASPSGSLPPVRSPRLPRSSKERLGWDEQSSPVMLELAGLQPHQYFGEMALLEAIGGEKHVEHSASVVCATDIECLLLSKYDFVKLIDAKTQDLMRAYADRFYLDEGRIRKTVHRQFRWEKYKQGLLQDKLTQRHRPTD